MQLRDKNSFLRQTAVTALVCAVLQLALAPNVALGSGRANFAFVFCVCEALFTGGGCPVALGFVAGLFFDLSSTGPVGLMSLLLSVLAFVLSQDTWSSMGSTVAGSVVAAVGSGLAVFLVYHLAMLFVGQSDSLIDAVVFRTLPTLLLSVAAFVPFALFFVRWHSQGPTLGGGKSASHLSLKGL